MKILFLDDMQIRHDAFRRNRIGHDITYVYTAQEAIRVLEASPPFDLIHLDHDLAEEHYLQASEGLSEDQQQSEAEYVCGTGMDVVDYLIKNTSKRPTAVIVHSFNAARAPEMVWRLQGAGIAAVWRRFDPHG